MIDALYQLLIFCISLVVLSKSSHTVIKNSVKIAKITQVDELVIGFILLSVATTTPELAVSFSAILSKNVGVSIGNLLGSNVTNLGLILSIPAIMSPIIIKKGTFEKLPSILFLSSIIPFTLFVIDELSRLIGILLIAAFVFFAYYSIKKKISLKFPKRRPREALKKVLIPIDLYKSIVFLCGGLLLVILSSNFVVSSASNISTVIGIAESVIGATIIAVGTSLPELSVALTAMKTKHPDLAIGNIIGACLINITLVLGIVLLFSPITINMSIFSTLLFFVVGITMISWYFFTTGRALDRMEGIFLLLVYVIFLISTFGAQMVIWKF